MAALPNYGSHLSAVIYNRCKSDHRTKKCAPWDKESGNRESYQHAMTLEMLIMRRLGVLVFAGVELIFFWWLAWSCVLYLCWTHCSEHRDVSVIAGLGLCRVKAFAAFHAATLVRGLGMHGRLRKTWLEQLTLTDQRGIPGHMTLYRHGHVCKVGERSRKEVWSDMSIFQSCCTWLQSCFPGHGWTPTCQREVN